MSWTALDWNELWRQTLMPAGLRLLAAITIWVIGGWVIRGMLAALDRALQAQKVDATLARYAQSFTRVALKVALFLGILGFLGVETTSFAALMAAAGVAIGVFEGVGVWVFVAVFVGVGVGVGGWLPE